MRVLRVLANIRSSPVRARNVANVANVANAALLAGALRAIERRRRGSGQHANKSIDSWEA